MLGQTKIETLLKRVLQLSSAPETEVIVVAEENNLTRFANNGIHQNVNESDVTVYLRAVDGKRVGRADTNDLSDDGLRKAAERALLHARMSPENPEFPGLPDPQPVTPIQAMDEATIEYSPQQRAESVGAICRLAEERGLKAFGAFSTSLTEYGIGSSRGVRLYHPATHADLRTVAVGESGSSWAQRSAWQVEQIDANAAGREAVAKALRAQHPIKPEAGSYTVVLDPYATLDLVQWLAFAGMSAEAVQEGRSWMNDRIGQKLMSELISIRDDGLDPTGIPLPFDFEGMPRRPVQIIEAGKIGGPVYDRITAARAGVESTGHTPPPGVLSFFSGPLPLHLYLQSGQSSVEEMIAATERGLYITRFWYTRLVHPRDCIVTGMTRDGVYQIENGQLTHAVKNLRFTQSYLTALANVVAVGRETQLLASYGTGMRVPALKINNFNFTGVTA